MSYAHKAECLAAGLDPKEVARIARGISRYAKQAEALNLEIFGALSGTLRVHATTRPGYVVATLDGSYNGGDGSCQPDEDGLLRGEEG